MKQWVPLSAEEQSEDEEVSFELFAADWATPGFKEFHRRAQLFVLLFIEAASYVDEDDPRWSFVTLYVYKPCFPSPLLARAGASG